MKKRLTDVWRGRTCLINVPALLRKLDAEDAARAACLDTGAKG